MFWRRHKSRDEDLDREIRAHLDLEAQEQRERGLSPQEARYAAKRALGNATLVKEQVRQMWRWNWLERSKQDLTYAIRTFTRTPGFTIVVILTLVLGIGATTAMFSVVNAVLLHPLPYRNPNRLVVIWETLVRDPKGPPVFDSYHDFEIWKRSSKSFERLALATWASGSQILTGIGPARGVLAMPVGIDFFRLLGVAPALGRTFQPDDLHRGCTVVLQHRFWMTSLGGRKNVIGRRIDLDQDPCTIVGVMPQGFEFYPDVAPMWRLITPESAIASSSKSNRNTSGPDCTITARVFSRTASSETSAVEDREAQWSAISRSHRAEVSYSFAYEVNCGEVEG